MKRLSRLLLLLVPLAIGLAAGHAPSGAQTAQPTPSGRFAFADTTLLRDTLDLKFTRLFPLADSLGIVPDSLRALAVRYRMSLERMTFLADSLRVPVDSVGTIMLREQFNPLASKVQRLTALQYTSSYNIQQTTSTWTNASDWNLVRGPLFVRNTTNVSMDRFQAGGQVNLRQTRSSLTESGWKFSNNLSLGGRANLERFDSQNPGNINNENETKNEFQVSARAKQQPSHDLTSELSFFGGALDVTNSSQVKRGLSADLTAKSRYERGSWLVHDVTGHASGNLARTRVPTETESFSTHDVGDNVDGTLSVLQTGLVGLNTNYSLRRVRVETPLDTAEARRIGSPDERIQQVRTDNNLLATTLHVRRDNDRYLNIAGRLGRSSGATATNLSSLNTRSDRDLNVQGRYRAWGWFIDASFDDGRSNSRWPERASVPDPAQPGGYLTHGGYVARSDARLIQTTLTRNFGGRFTLKADGRVSLSLSRYDVLGVNTHLPNDTDEYRQSYRIDAQYNRSQKLSTGGALEVIRSQLVNFVTAGVNETRTYRAEWRWTFRLFSSLTATQLDQLNADYDVAPLNNRLSLTYKALTTLNAVVTPRTTIEITHNAQITPSGNYALQDDGLEYFSKSDEGRNYTLRARVTFQPATLFALNVQSEYLADARSTVTNGGLVPQRDSRTLNFSGGGNLNVPLGAKGKLTGDLSRSYRGDRSSSFQNGALQPSPRYETDYWFGRLELSWSL